MYVYIAHHCVKTHAGESGSNHKTSLTEEILTGLVPLHLIQFTKLISISSSPRLSKTNKIVLVFKEFIE